MRSFRSWLPWVLLFLALPAAAGEPAGPEAEALRADDALAMMEVYADAQRTAAAVAKGREACTLYLMLGRRRDAARVQTRVGALCIEAKRFNEARWELDASLAMQEEIGDIVGRCLTLALKVELALAGPNPAEGIGALEEGFALVEAHGLRGPFFVLETASKKVREALAKKKPAPRAYFDLCAREGRFLMAAGWMTQAEGLLYEKVNILQRDGRRAEAVAACLEIAAFNQERDYAYGVAAAHHNVGLVVAADESLGEGRFERADGAYRKAQEIRARIGDRMNLAWTLNNRGFLLLERKAFAEALPLFEEAAKIFLDHGMFDGARTALENLGRLGREWGRDELPARSEKALKELEGLGEPAPEAVRFVPERRQLAYYVFLREDDLAPVVRVRGEGDALVFTVLASGEEFRLPCSPRPKELRIEFEAPQYIFSKDPVPVARSVFTVFGGRGVRHGQTFVFLEEGAEATADRQGNLALGKGRVSDRDAFAFDLEAETYQDTATPVTALRTAFESLNRGEWEAFNGAVSRFALSWINRESFDETHKKQAVLPIGIVIARGSLRNPGWAEIRYSYEGLYDRALQGVDPQEKEARRKELKETFRKAFGANRYKAFLVREPGGWRVDYWDLDPEGEGTRD